ncbi:MAG: hypothetical protein OEM04_12465, partial [Flavobacteriaceae bacterium]|nr:hypothetical protein [Flavobacteriaceae bacterium]
MKTSIIVLLTAVLLQVLVTGCNDQSNTAENVSKGKKEKLDRTNLPIQPPAMAAITEMDARNATKPERFEVKAPEGAPNV